MVLLLIPSYGCFSLLKFNKFCLFLFSLLLFLGGGEVGLFFVCWRVFQTVSDFFFFFIIYCISSLKFSINFKPKYLFWFQFLLISFYFFIFYDFTKKFFFECNYPLRNVLCSILLCSFFMIWWFVTLLLLFFFNIFAAVVVIVVVYYYYCLRL